MNGKYCVYYLRLDMFGASSAGKTRHPQLEMADLGKSLNFNILESEPITIGDCWLFLVESDDVFMVKKLPSWVDCLGLPRDYIKGKFRKAIYEK